MLPNLTFGALLNALLLSTTVSAQYSPLSGAPACAQQCSALTAAVATCQNAGTPAQIATCFCTQPTTAGFANNNAICQSCASSSSPQAGMQWFAGFCAGSNLATITGSAPSATSAMSSSAPAAAATTTTSAAAAGTSSSATSSTSAAATNSATDIPIYTQASTGSWWSNHARWIVMVIVLVVAFAIIIAVGVIWKKRYNKKHGTGDILPAGTPWGPAQHQGGAGQYYGGEKGATSYAMQRQYP